MPPKAPPQRRPVPWYRTKRFVACAGSITGFLVFGYLSILIVFYSSRFGDDRPQVASSTANIDVTAFMSSFHPKFSPSNPVEAYYWPPNAPVLEFSNYKALPFVITAHAIPDWHMLFQWASGISWLAGNDMKYDFQAQKSPIFWSHHQNKVLASKVPTTTVEETEIHYITLQDYYSAEFQDSPELDHLPKYKKFEGIVRRQIDALREFPNAPNEAQFTGELKNHDISLILQSHGVHQQPYLSLSGQLFMQVSGETDWILSSPEEASKYELNSFFHPLSLQAQLDLHTKLNSTYLASMSLDENSLGGEEDSDIHVQYIRLFPGQLLFVPPFWVTQSLASSTSVSIKVSLENTIEDQLEMMVRTETIEEVKKTNRSCFGA